MEPRRQRLSATLVLLLAALTAIGPLTINLYLPAFPEIAADLGAGAGQVQLTMTAMLAGLALGQLIIGSVSDTTGRRPPLVIAFACYGVLSLAIAAVPTVELLMVLRFAQGLAAAAGMVIALAIVRDSYSGFVVGKAIARLMLVVGVAPVLAPALGAQLLRVGSWRLLFLVLAGVSLVLLVIVVAVLQETLPPEARRTGGTRAALRSYASLLGDRSFTGLVLVAGFAIAGQFAYVSSSTFVFQVHYGLDAQEFGVLFGVGALTVTAGTQVTGVLLGRVPAERILAWALACAVGASVLLVLTASTLAADGRGLWVLVPVLLVTIGCVGATIPAVPAIALARQTQDAGSASALIGGAQFGMAAVGAPITGLLGQSALMMALVMCAMLSLAGAVLLVTSRPASPAAPAGGRPGSGR